jgi:carotenoid cleavage dioxygenase
MSENLFLEGNFAPVAEEVTAFDLAVKGEIPKQLEGRLLRIGPNPIAPVPESHHWFLGNGMVHGLRLRDGKALWYRNRYVVDDEVAEAKGLAAIETPSRENSLGEGVVNTNVIQHAGKTLAIVEAGSMPIELGYELETIRRSDFSGTLRAGLSAHPICDHDTGELHTAVYSPMSQAIQYVVVGKEGRVRKTVDVPVPGSPMVHGCMITKNYFILLDLPVVLDPAVLEAGFSIPYKWHPEYGARVGLLPREGRAEDVTWHEVDPCYVFHPMNAYEDDAGRVVLDVVRHSEMFASDMQGPTDGASTLDRWLIDPASGSVKQDRLDDESQEFPRIDERLNGKAYRFGYTVAPGGLKKYDLTKGTSQLHNEGDNRIFFEPVFVPESPDAGEDEGWIMAYVYDQARDASDVVILHAQDFEAPPIATISLPQRVPFGFHGNWVPDNGAI